MDCCICFTPTSTSVTCSNRICSATICYKCICDMIAFCTQNYYQMPACPAQNCEGEYLYSVIKPALSPEFEQQYENICSKHLERDGDDADEKSRRKALKADMIQQLRQQNRQIIATFPPAISRIITLGGLEPRYKAILVANETFRTGIVAGTIVPLSPCLAMMCKGSMVENGSSLKCDKCGLIMCSECGNLKTDPHICKQEDIESKKVLKSIIKCPTCNVPTTKGEGCKFVTCPMCNTNFHSDTGEMTRSGGHSRPLKFKTYKLTDLSDNLEVKRLLKTIEGYKQPAPKPLKSSAKFYERLKNRKLYDEAIRTLHYHSISGNLPMAICQEVANYAKGLLDKKE